ncbi:PepSY domain-containing protein [Veillonella agrestimuris]|uniref:PepSY domain-containing protein n=1 Tax=Veillonella agrestimuris TaxID=2941340 RepID=UPI00203EE2C6|nr:PepSY domain-containing protein [Veillonella agrestimuris]
MKHIMKTFVLGAVMAIGATSVVSAYTSNEQVALDAALARVPGATYAHVTEFERDYENGRLQYEGEIRYNGYEYDFEIDAENVMFVKWSVERDN